MDRGALYPDIFARKSIWIRTAGEFAYAQGQMAVADKSLMDTSPHAESQRLMNLAKERALAYNLSHKEKTTPEAEYAKIMAKNEAHDRTLLTFVVAPIALVCLGFFLFVAPVVTIQMLLFALSGACFLYWLSTAPESDPQVAADYRASEERKAAIRRGYCEEALAKYTPEVMADLKAAANNKEAVRAKAAVLTAKFKEERATMGLLQSLGHWFNQDLYPDVSRYYKARDEVRAAQEAVNG